jgi:hypothetical protein
MPDTKPKISFSEDTAQAKFGRSLDALVEAVRCAVNTTYPYSDSTPNTWTKDVQEDVVIVERGTKFFSLPWSIDESGNVTLGEETEVEVDYKPKTANFSEEIVEREAKLFEAGEYPDKDVAVTEEDLDQMVANHPTEGVPVKIEHEDTAFDGGMGVVKSIYRKGKELLGTLSFPKPTWAFISTAGAKKLSAGIKRDKSGLTEVSIVRNPRVADAQIFKDTESVIRFSADVDWDDRDAEPTKPAVPNTTPTQEVKNMPNTDTSNMSVADAMKVIQSVRPDSPEAKAIFEAATQMVNFSKATENELKKTATAAKAALTELQKANTESLITNFKREGKLTPAAEGYARAILSAKPLAGTTPEDDQVVKFSDKEGKEQEVHFAECFVKFLEALSPVVSFKEMVRNEENSAANLTQAQLEIAEKMGLSREDVIKYSR